jgi:glycosyltransferase involved in cell wall biosynthesis
MGQVLQTMLAEGRWQAIYLHGLMPFVIAAPLLHRVRDQGTRVLLSPHSSRSLRSMKFLAHPILWGLHRFLPMAGIETIASVPFDVRAMQRLSRVSARLIEPPVDEVFFSVHAQRQANPAVIVGGASYDAKGAAQRFAQVAVLLPGSLPDAKFVWIGPASSEDRAVLKASGIEVLSAADDGVPDAYVRAECLANAALYVSCGEGRGFGMALAEALAVGLPCLSLNPDGQSDILVHHETGLICRTVEELAIRSINLMQSPELRLKLSEQARREAVLRFSDQEFRRHIVALFAHSDRRQKPRAQ